MAIDTQKIISARRSANLMLQDWANRGVNLWAVDQIVVPLIKGVATYSIDPATVNLLDCYRRQFEIGAPVSITPTFSTVINTANVVVTLNNHGLAVNLYTDFPIPVAVGGLIILGFYKVTAVIDQNNFQITAAQNATSTVTNGGAVPVFTTTANSSSVSVALAAHGLVAGQNFQVEVPTTVGGFTLLGIYPVASVTDANDFVITVPGAAGSNAVASENGGLCQIATQLQNVDPIDVPMFPLSRNDYSQLPDKSLQGTPTTFWFDRVLQPTTSIWPVPDGSQPYEFRAYRMRELYDANPIGPQTLDTPNRFLEAFCAELAAKVALKWKPDLFDRLALLADKAWRSASGEDREKVPFYLSPDFSSYY